MHYLNKDELETLKVNWSPKQFKPWAIEPSGDGVIAFTKSNDETETAALFCRKDKIPRLYIRPDSKDIEWYVQALAAIKTMTAFGVDIPKGQIELKNISGAPAIEVA
jgi:hypothetical protein